MSASGSTRSRLVAAIRLAVGLAAFAGVVVYVAPSWSELTAQVDVSIGALTVALVAITLVHAVVAARWKLLTEATGGNRLSLWAYLHSLLVTRFLGQFVPSLAMDLVGRGVVLRSVGSKRGVGHATTLVVLERIFDVVLPALLLGWALAIRTLDLGAGAAALLLAASALAFVAVATPGLGPLARLAITVYRTLTRKAVGDVPVEITAPIAFRVAVLSVTRFGLVVVQFAAIGAGIGVRLPWTGWASATPVAQLSALVGVTPGGLGVVEAGWWAGLAWVGVPRATTALFLVAQRAALVVFLGALTLATTPFARRSGDARAVEA